jgi:hypothetical protein
MSAPISVKARRNTFFIYNKFIPTIQRITVFMSKEPVLRLARQALIPVLRLARQALIALAVHK